MEKVKITRKQADLLDRILENTDLGWLFEQLSAWNTVTTCTQNMSDLHAFYIKDPLLASTAMIVGYEVEETPEDKVLEYFNVIHVGESNAFQTRRSIIKKTLELLNIKIEGIN